MNATAAHRVNFHLLDIGEQNAYVIDAIALARSCVGRLVHEGFTVLSVHVEHHRPVVWIQNGSLCGELDGAVMIRRRGVFGIECVMAAIVEGCQVHWRVAGH